MGPLEYKLTDNELQVLLAGVIVRRLPFYNIEGVTKGYTMWNETWLNVWPMEFITIRRRDGWIRNFVINPENADQFITDMKSRIHGLNGSGKGYQPSASTQPRP